MQTADLDSYVFVPLSTKLYRAIDERYPDGVPSLIEDVVTDFLERTEIDFYGYIREKKGVQWTSVFLPSGTELRTKYKGEYKTAEIVEDEIVWNGQIYPSVSNLANAMRNHTSNNAWLTLEVKLPKESKWQVADRLRG